METSEREIAFKKFNENLYEQMTHKQLVGHFFLDKGWIYWHISDYVITIGQDYIGIGKRATNSSLQLFDITHWHPEDDEILDDICLIGTKGNVTVVHDGLLVKTVLYSGPRDACPVKRKWLFGKYYYIYAD